MLRGVQALASGLGMWWKLARDRREYRRQPVNAFTVNGYEIVPGYFSAEECQRLVALADRHLRPESYTIKDNCYLARRNDKATRSLSQNRLGEADSPILLRGLRKIGTVPGGSGIGSKVDTQVAQFFNIQEIDARMAELYASGRIEGMFESRIGQKMRLQSITLQVDDPDTRTKRGYHIDSASPPNYKAFVYLSDVLENGDGPYTVVPGSHRDRVQKVLNRMYNVWHDYPRTDMRLHYTDAMATPILGRAGTLILSCQHLAHKGWHQHDRRRRYMLVCYLVPWKYWDGKPFMLGKLKDKRAATARKAA